METAQYVTVPTGVGKTHLAVGLGLKAIEHGENVVFLGPPGVGKSHLAVGLGLKAIEHGYTACSSPRRPASSPP